MNKKIFNKTKVTEAYGNLIHLLESGFIER